MIARRIKSIRDVVDWGLCTGCGACEYASANGAIKMVNITSVGLRPQVDPHACEGIDNLSICPGVCVDASKSASIETHEDFGPFLEIWKGHASDPTIRFHASSGGLLTALSLYCLEHEGMSSVVHTGTDRESPWLNRTVESKTLSELLARTGSRYAPASPCTGLQLIEKSSAPCVFIGKPCDVAAAHALRLVRPELDKRIGLLLTFFCAGTPSTQGTLDLMTSLGVAQDDVKEVRYRGKGWPGEFTVQSRNGAGQQALSYTESWGRLTGYRPLRCNLCPDGLGQLGDLSCGDAWDEQSTGAVNPGLSIVIVRTPRGREILRRAAAAGYVLLSPASSETVLAAQPNLLKRRRELLGRLLAMKALLIPTPSFNGFFLLKSWLRLSLRAKFRSIGGTAKRIISRGLWRKCPLFTNAS